MLNRAPAAGPDVGIALAEDGLRALLLGALPRRAGRP